LFRFNGEGLLIDCGEGTQVALREAGFSPNPISIICLTHYHADHVSGLPGFLLSMGNSDRTEPVTIVGPKGLERVVNSLRVIAPELPFEIKFHEIKSDDEYFEIMGYHIHAFKVNHNVLCYGYSIDIPRKGRFEVEKAKSMGLPVQLWNPLQKGNQVEYEGKTYTPDMVMGQARKGLKVTYCTDTRPTKSLVDAAEDSDLLICEGMYAEEDKLAKARQNKHMTFYEAAQVAKDAKVGELWLTHFSPSMTGHKRYMKAVCDIFPQAKLGEDGKFLELDFAEE
jgi:ribonuclease Z